MRNYIYTWLQIFKTQTEDKHIAVNYHRAYQLEKHSRTISQRTTKKIEIEKRKIKFFGGGGSTKKCDHDCDQALHRGKFVNVK